VLRAIRYAEANGKVGRNVAEFIDTPTALTRQNETTPGNGSISGGAIISGCWPTQGLLNRSIL